MDWYSKITVQLVKHYGNFQEVTSNKRNFFEQRISGLQEKFQAISNF